MQKTEVKVGALQHNWLFKFSLPTVLYVAHIDVPVQTHPVRNLWVMFSKGITIRVHVADIIRSAVTTISPTLAEHAYLYMLTTEAAKLAVHTLVASKLGLLQQFLGLE